MLTTSGEQCNIRGYDPSPLSPLFPYSRSVLDLYNYVQHNFKVVSHSPVSGPDTFLGQKNL